MHVCSSTSNGGTTSRYVVSIYIRISTHADAFITHVLPSINYYAVLPSARSLRCVLDHGTHLPQEVTAALEAEGTLADLCGCRACMAGCGVGAGDEVGENSVSISLSDEDRPLEDCASEMT